MKWSEVYAKHPELKPKGYRTPRAPLPPVGFRGATSTTPVASSRDWEGDLAKLEAKMNGLTKDATLSKEQIESATNGMFAADFDTLVEIHKPRAAVDGYADDEQFGMF